MRPLTLAQILSSSMSMERKESEFVLCSMNEWMYQALIQDLKEHKLEYIERDDPVGIGFVLNGCHYIAIYNIDSNISSWYILGINRIKELDSSEGFKHVIESEKPVG